MFGFIAPRAVPTLGSLLAILAPAFLLLTGLSVDAAAAQEGEAYRYELRNAGGPAVQALTEGAEEKPPVPDVSGDRTPQQVLQGPGITLVGPLGEELTWESAQTRLMDNARVMSGGAGGTLIKSWPELRVEVDYETLRVDVRRGNDDATVAGRDAKHYVMEAELLRRHPEGRKDQRFLITSQLWVLEDLPFSWAPFGVLSDALPSYDSRLRAAMEEELAELGLVARAVTTVGFEVLGPDDAPGDPSNGGSTQVKAFEIANISRTSAPVGPDAPVVTKAFTRRLERALTQRPAEMCGQLVAGEIPDVIRKGIPEADRAGVVSSLAAHCEEDPSGLFFGLLEPIYTEDPEAFCQAVSSAEDPDALARAIFTDVQARGFDEMLSPEEKEEFAAKVRPACGG